MNEQKMILGLKRLLNPKLSPNMDLLSLKRFISVLINATELGKKDKQLLKELQKINQKVNEQITKLTELLELEAEVNRLSKNK